MTIKTKFTIKFASCGFVVGAALGVYAFYLTAHHMIADWSILLFLILCPFSLGAVAFDSFDNVGTLGGITGWFCIALGNAALYAAIGRALKSRKNSK